MNAYPVFNGNGEVVLVTEHVRDITLPRQAEEALRASEERYRTLVETINMGVYRITDENEAHILWANPWQVRMLGYDSLEELCLVRVTDLFVQSVEGQMAFDQLRSNGSMKNRELQLRKKDGTRIWVSVTAHRRTGKNGQAGWIEGIIEDITERKEVEEALRVSEEKFRELFNKANDAIFLMEYLNGGATGRFIEVNEGACRILGFSREDFLTLSCEEIWSDAGVHDMDAVLQELREVGHVMYETELRSRHRGRIPFEVSSHTFTLHGRIVVLSIARDITERRILQEIEKTAFDQIQKNINQFAILGDHIRNPLAVIVGLADLDGSDTSKKIINQAYIIDKLITQLDVGWIESEKVKEFVKRHYG